MDQTLHLQIHEAISLPQTLPSESSKDGVVTNSLGVGLFTAETKPKSPVFYVTGRMAWVSAA